MKTLQLFRALSMAGGLTCFIFYNARKAYEAEI